MANNIEWNWSIFRRWGFFEYTLTVIVLLSLGAAAYLLIPKSGYATVTVLVGNRELLYNNGGALPVLETGQYVPGLEGKDVFGRLEAKIVSVDAYPHVKDNLYGRLETVYVTMKVAASYNAKRGTYKYKGITMQMGDWLRVDIGPVAVEGIITDINGEFSKAEAKTLRVKAQLKTEDPLGNSAFSNTTGVDAYIADGIKVGDTMTDSNGAVLAKIIDKIVVPARTLTGDLYGNVFERPNPRKMDVYLVVDVKVKQVGSLYYYLSGEPVKINSRLPLFLSGIDIEPRITDVVSGSSSQP